jgi:hypothetical protein
LKPAASRRWSIAIIRQALAADALRAFRRRCSFAIVAIVLGFISLMAAEAETKIEYENALKREAARKTELQTIAEDLISWLGEPKE